MDGSQSHESGTATAAWVSMTGWVKWKCQDRRPCGHYRDQHKYLVEKNHQGLGHETRNVLMRARLVPWYTGNPTVGKWARHHDHHFREHWLWLNVAVGQMKWWAVAVLTDSWPPSVTVRSSVPTWEAQRVSWQIPRQVFLLLKNCREKPPERDVGNQSPNLTWSQMCVAEGWMEL